MPGPIMEVDLWLGAYLKGRSIRRVRLHPVGRAAQLANRSCDRADRLFARQQELAKELMRTGPADARIRHRCASGSGGWWRFTGRTTSDHRLYYDFEWIAAPETPLQPELGRRCYEAQRHEGIAVQVYAARLYVFDKALGVTLATLGQKYGTRLIAHWSRSYLKEA